MPKNGVWWVWICHGLECAKDRRALHSFPLWQQLHEFYLYEAGQAFRSGFVFINGSSLVFSTLVIYMGWVGLCVCVGVFFWNWFSCFILERLDWNGWCSNFYLLLNGTVPAPSPLSHVFMLFVFPFVCSSSFFYKFAYFCFISSAFPFCNLPCWLSVNPSNPSIFTFISPLSHKSTLILLIWMSLKIHTPPEVKQFAPEKCLENFHPSIRKLWPSEGIAAIVTFNMGIEATTPAQLIADRLFSRVASGRIH